MNTRGNGQNIAIARKSPLLPAIATILKTHALAFDSHRRLKISRGDQPERLSSLLLVLMAVFRPPTFLLRVRF